MRLPQQCAVMDWVLWLLYEIWVFLFELCSPLVRSISFLALASWQDGLSNYQAARSPISISFYSSVITWSLRTHAVSLTKLCASSGRCSSTLTAPFCLPSITPKAQAHKQICGYDVPISVASQETNQSNWWGKYWVMSRSTRDGLQSSRIGFPLRLDCCHCDMATISSAAPDWHWAIYCSSVLCLSQALGHLLLCSDLAVWKRRAGVCRYSSLHLLINFLLISFMLMWSWLRV